MSDTAPFGCKVPSGLWRIAPFKKRSEYAALEVPEYWIVDPQENKVTVLVLNEGLYEESIFTASQTIASPTFKQLKLTAEAILSVK